MESGEYLFEKKKGFWNVSEYDLSFFQENVELIVYSALAFLVPFAIGHPQFLVGIVVNAAIVLAALNLRNEKLLPVLILPSLAVFSRGLIFGPFTFFLLFMVPFIWVGNFILLASLRELMLKRKIKSYVSLFVGASAKALFLFFSALILVKTGVIPSIFLSSMGIVQFYTAIIGGAVALGVHNLKKNYIR